MEWIISGCLSIVLVLIGGASTYYLSKTKKKFFSMNSVYALAACIFLSNIILSLPAYLNEMGGTFSSAVTAILLSIHNAVKVFTADGEYSVIVNNVKN